MDNPYQSPLISPSEQSPKTGVRPLPVLRDLAILWVLTMIGGFFVGFTGALQHWDIETRILALAGSNILCIGLGFMIAGCLAPPGRWPHLACVAIGTWLSGLLNVALFGVSISDWMASAVVIFVMMGVGGAISFVFRPESRQSY